ncbi:isochorismate synthase, putative, partial [Ricinus communis]
MKRYQMKVPHAGSVVDLASGMLTALQAAFPVWSQEFSGLFSYSVGATKQAFIGVGCEYELSSRRDRKILHVGLSRDTDTLHQQSYALGDSAGVAEIFARAADFMREVRPILLRSERVPDWIPLLGGWRSAAQPNTGQSDLVFTIPRIVCRIDEGALHIFSFCDMEDGGAQNAEQLFDQLIAKAKAHCDAAPGVLEIAAEEDIPECREYVDHLVELIRSLSQEAMEKVVICREVRLRLGRDTTPLQLLRMAAHKRNPRYQYLFQWWGGEAWVGISPELLMRKDGETIAVEPLAGTRKSAASAEKNEHYRQELLNDPKEIEEHETAANLFLSTLQSVCQPESVVQTESLS